MDIWVNSLYFTVEKSKGPESLCDIVKISQHMKVSARLLIAFKSKYTLSYVSSFEIFNQ